MIQEVYQLQRHTKQMTTFITVHVSAVVYNLLQMIITFVLTNDIKNLNVFTISHHKRSCHCFKWKQFIIRSSVSKFNCRKITEKNYDTSDFDELIAVQ